MSGARTDDRPTVPEHDGVQRWDDAIVVTAPGEIAVRPVPENTGPVAVRMLYSGVSAGTELAFLTGSHPALHSRFDAEYGLFRPGGDSAFPIERLGYMEVGEVTEAPELGPPVGSTVALTCGHRTATRVDPRSDRLVVLPPDLDPVLGVYVAHMGPICANGLLHAAAEECGTDVRTLGDGVRGKQVAVVGGGVVGLLTGLFARHHGAASVVLLDPTPERRAAAEGLGLDTLDPDATDPADVLKSRFRHGAGDRGADVVFQCRGRTAALALALRLLRPQGTVVDLAFYSDDGSALQLGAEFHHNGLGVRCAQIGRVPRGTAHRWNRERLSAATLDLLHHHGAAVREHVVTDVVPFAEGPALLRDLSARRRHVIQAVLAC